MRVCFQFRDSGQCRFAAECKFSHQAAASTSKQRKRKQAPDRSKANKRATGDCFAFQRTGQCLKKRCPFRHGDTGELVALPPPSASGAAALPALLYLWKQGKLIEFAGLQSAWERGTKLRMAKKYLSKRQFGHALTLVASGGVAPRDVDMITANVPPGTVPYSIPDILPDDAQFLRVHHWPNTRIVFLSPGPDYDAALLQAQHILTKTTAVGIDVECVPCFAKGGKPQPALLQLAARTTLMGPITVIVIDLVMGLSPAVQTMIGDLFTASHITKVGYAFAGDVRDLRRAFPGGGHVFGHIAPLVDVQEVQRAFFAGTATPAYTSPMLRDPPLSSAHAAHLAMREEQHVAKERVRDKKEGEDDLSPLHISFHQHQYGLGAHYNSLVDIKN